MTSELEKQQTAQKLSTLRFQNGKLSAQLHVQRSQITDLENKLEAQDAKRDVYADTLLTVNSLWIQLNADIKFLSSRCLQVRRFLRCIPAKDVFLVNRVRLRRSKLGDIPSITKSSRSASVHNWITAPEIETFNCSNRSSSVLQNMMQDRVQLPRLQAVLLPGMHYQCCALLDACCADQMT